jgi:hypothetical protein
VGNREERDAAEPAPIHLIHDEANTECGVKRGLGLHYTTTPALTTCPTCLSMITALVSLDVEDLTPAILFGETA